MKHLSQSIVGFIHFFLSDFKWYRYITKKLWYKIEYTENGIKQSCWVLNLPEGYLSHMVGMYGHKDGNFYNYSLEELIKLFQWVMDNPEKAEEILGRKITILK